PLGSVAGIAPAKDGLWLASLDGEARRIDAHGALLARFDATPAPRGVDWNEKKRLVEVAAHPEAAPLADVVAALGVGRHKGADLLWARIEGASKEAAPLVLEAVVKGRLDGGTLAEMFRRTMPETRETFAAALVSK